MAIKEKYIRLPVPDAGEKLETSKDLAPGDISYFDGGVISVGDVIAKHPMITAVTHDEVLVQGLGDGGIVDIRLHREEINEAKFALGKETTIFELKWYDPYRSQEE